MRYVPTLCLRAGMILGKNIYGNNEQLLLTIGTVLNETYIDSIKKLGFSGVYINDSLSDDIEVVSVINDNLRQRTIKGLKDVFVAIDTESKDKYKKMDLLKEHIENMLEEILNNNNLLVNMVDLKCFDDYTYQHSVNVAVLSIIMGVALKLNKDKLYKLGLAALLHDIGKVFVSKDILNKPGKLTFEEFEEMKNHALYGYTYLKREFDFPVQSYVGALDHHEKFDGTGYPNKKSGDDISLFGRIISIADIYDALTSERPYRVALLPSEGMEYIMGGSDTYFDHSLISIFVKKVAPYPLGTCLNLTNGYTGIVTKNYEDACLRPDIRVFEIYGEKVEPFTISLRTDKSLLSTTIKSVIKA